MKLIIVLSLVIGSALAASTNQPSFGETIDRVAELENGSNRSNTLNINSTFGENKYTLLHLAILLDHSGHIVPLIQKGANVNAINKAGYAPLHVAVTWTESDQAARLLIENGRQNMVNLLINNGANQEALGIGGKKPRDFENDPNRQRVIHNINKFMMELKQSHEEDYNNTVKALGIA